MKIIKKYWKYISRDREVGRGRGRPHATWTWTWTGSKLRTIPLLTPFLYY